MNRFTDQPSHRITGFTLVETLIASTVLAGAVAALVVPFSVAVEHQRLGAVQTTAVSLAGQMIERCLTMSYAEATALNGVTECGADITGPDDQPLNDATLADYTLSISAVEQEILAGAEAPGEGTIFCVLSVTVSHADIEPVVLSRLIAPGVP